MSEDATTERLKQLIEQRIVFFDGAMGTMIQRAGLEKPTFGATDFATIRAACRGTTTCWSSHDQT